MNYIIINRDQEATFFVTGINYAHSFSLSANLERAYVFPDFDSAFGVLRRWTRQSPEHRVVVAENSIYARVYLLRGGRELLELEAVPLDQVIIESVLLS